MKTKLLLIALGLLVSNYTQGQNSKLTSLILKHDSIFWKGYNKCDLLIFEKYITDDFEFYHDKGGLTVGKDKFLKSIEDGLCKKDNGWSLRREVVDQSIEIFPLNKYGAILRGKHVFYLKENGKDEKLVEIAQFTHVWKNDNDSWKMSRVLSFDHKSVPQNTNKKELVLSEKDMRLFVGKYQAPKTGNVNITIEKGGLYMSAGQMKSQLFPESSLTFFMKQAPLTFEFVKKENGSILKMIVKEQGKIVEEAIRVHD